MIVSTTCFATNKNQILVYNDSGVEETPLKQTLNMLHALTDQYEIKTINANDIINTDWEENTALLVIPGGADIPYAKKLNGKGNQKIINYVKNGGSYLGICAGGYYGANNIEFAKGTELEVIGKRELNFYPGKAVGPALAHYVYNSNEGARAAKLIWQNNEVTTYFNGGAYFEKPTNYKHVTVLARYKTLPEQNAAIVKINVDNGTVVLSGVHFEYDFQLLNKNDQYVNSIIPKLQTSNNQRLLLAKELLLSLSIKTGKDLDA